jgi:hypothetical protein
MRSPWLVWQTICQSLVQRRYGSAANSRAGIVARGGLVSSLTIFIIGFVILVAGLAYGASLAGLSTQWIAVGVLVLLGMGIAMGVTRTRQRDPSQTPQ